MRLGRVPKELPCKRVFSWELHEIKQGVKALQFDSMHLYHTLTRTYTHTHTHTPHGWKLPKQPIPETMLLRQEVASTCASMAQREAPILLHYIRASNVIHLNMCLSSNPATERHKKGRLIGQEYHQHRAACTQHWVCSSKMLRPIQTLESLAIYAAMEW